MPNVEKNETNEILDKVKDIKGENKSNLQVEAGDKPVSTEPELDSNKSYKNNEDVLNFGSDDSNPKESIMVNEDHKKESVNLPINEKNNEDKNDDFEFADFKGSHKEKTQQIVSDNNNLDTKITEEKPIIKSKLSIEAVHSDESYEINSKNDIPDSHKNEEETKKEVEKENSSSVDNDVAETNAKNVKGNNELEENKNSMIEITKSQELTFEGNMESPMDDSRKANIKIQTKLADNTSEEKSNQTKSSPIEINFDKKDNDQEDDGFGDFELTHDQNSINKVEESVPTKDQTTVINKENELIPDNKHKKDNEIEQQTKNSFDDLKTKEIPLVDNPIMDTSNKKENLPFDNTNKAIETTNEIKEELKDNENDKANEKVRNEIQEEVKENVSEEINDKSKEETKDEIKYDTENIVNEETKDNQKEDTKDDNKNTMHTKIKDEAKEEIDNKLNDKTEEEAEKDLNYEKEITPKESNQNTETKKQNEDEFEDFNEFELSENKASEPQEIENIIKADSENNDNKEVKPANDNKPGIEEIKESPKEIPNKDENIKNNEQGSPSEANEKIESKEEDEFNDFKSSDNNKPAENLKIDVFEPNSNKEIDNKEEKISSPSNNPKQEKDSAFINNNEDDFDNFEPADNKKIFPPQNNDEANTVKQEKPIQEVKVENNKNEDDFEVAEDKNPNKAEDNDKMNSPINNEKPQLQDEENSNEQIKEKKDQPPENNEENNEDDDFGDFCDFEAANDSNPAPKIEDSQISIVETKKKDQDKENPPEVKDETNNEELKFDKENDDDFGNFEEGNEQDSNNKGGIQESETIPKESNNLPKENEEDDDFNDFEESSPDNYVESKPIPKENTAEKSPETLNVVKPPVPVDNGPDWSLENKPSAPTPNVVL